MKKVEISINNYLPLSYLQFVSSLHSRNFFNVAARPDNIKLSRSNDRRIWQHFVDCCHVGNNFLLNARIESEKHCIEKLVYNIVTISQTHLGRIQLRPWMKTSLSAVCNPSQIKWFSRERETRKLFSNSVFSVRFSLFSVILLKSVQWKWNWGWLWNFWRRENHCAELY